VRAKLPKLLRAAAPGNPIRKRGTSGGFSKGALQCCVGRFWKAAVYVAKTVEVIDHSV